jgi:hypothetical protein
VALQDIAHGLVAHSVFDVGQGAGDSIVAPEKFPFAKRTIRASTSWSTGGRPGYLRFFEPSNFFATKRLCQARMVSG